MTELQTPTVEDLAAMVATLAADLADLAGFVYATAVEEEGPSAFIATLHHIADDVERIQGALGRAEGPDR